MQDSQIIILNVFIELFIAIILAFLVSYMVLLYNKRQIALKLNFDKELRTAMLEIQEQTSLHISRELHDNVNGYLTLAKLNLNTSISLMSDTTKAKAEDTLELLSHSIEEIRNLSRTLNPEHIAFDNLPDMLEEYTGWIKRTSHFHINLTVTGEPSDLQKETEVILFRILQEIINNILKHSQANLVNLSLNYTGQQLKCTVSDNGIGFNVKEKLNEGYTTHSLGLQNILRRAKMINATCDIQSSELNGTTICITTPYKKEAIEK